MPSERIDGIKYPDWEHQPDSVVLGIYGHLLDRRDQLDADIERVSGTLIRRDILDIGTVYLGLNPETPEEWEH